jgi:hypothetical protein
LNSLQPQHGFRRWLGYLSIAILLLAACAQAVHLCSLHAAQTEGAPQAYSSSSASTLCLTCLMAQTATMVAFFVVLATLLMRRPRVFGLQQQPRSFLASFQLYVRPPPAF